MEKLDVYALLDELQEEIEMSPTKGFSKSKLVDAKIVMEILEDIRHALKDELEFSKRVLKEKEQIIKGAQAQADEIRKQANVEVEDMVKESAVVRAAQEKSDQILENSRKKAGDIRKSAIDYAEDLFNDLESYYKESIDLIHENKARLHGKGDPSKGGMPNSSAQ